MNPVNPETEFHHAQASNPFPIAIIGIGCRFPGGVEDPETYWRLLVESRDAVREVPGDRWSVSKFYHPTKGIPGKTYSKWAGLLDSIDQFDPEVFGISPREAPYMDPQQRLLLEVAWDAFEDAGQTLDKLSGSRAGVYVGISSNDYAQVQGFDQTQTAAHSATGGAFSIAANRISYCFNLNGPSLAVDTACSSSLVAVSLACSSLWRGESDLALAGGVNVILSVGPFIAFSAATMLSADGRCKSFDASGDGFVRGEGAGMVLLKPLRAALEDHDPVYAVIIGTGINQDARTGGISLPSQTAQQCLLEEAYAKLGLAADDVFYVEAHGTGTTAGDPIEATAIGNVLGRPRKNDSRLLIGSVKSNIGHLESGAGIAGLIKASLVLSRRQVPPNLHFCNPNPKIDFSELKLKVVNELTAAPPGAGRLVAGVNSFGFGGTNAHVVLASVADLPIPPCECAPMRSQWLFPLSANSKDQLRQLARDHADYLAAKGYGVAMRDLCYTASCRRNHFQHRLAITAETPQELGELLQAFAAGEKRREFAQRMAISGMEATRPAFIFSGQGPQWWGMARELLATSATFRRVMEQVDAEVQRLGNWSLLEEMAKDEEQSRMDNTAVAQPALFALQIGLVKVLEEWGITPGIVLGHSVGEVAAAHVAGALDLLTAIRVIFHRGRCMAAAPGGRMLALGVTAEEARALIQPFGQRISLGAHNGPESVTLSGDAGCLEQLAERFADGSIFCRFLPVNYAFHSAHMDTIQDDLLNALAGIKPQRTTVDMVSTVLADIIDGESLGQEYWWNNIRQSVQFHNALNVLLEQGHRIFIEISPHPVLAASMAGIFSRRRERCEHIATLRRDAPDTQQILSTLGNLHAVGIPIKWSAFWPEGGHYIRLPGYPWRRQRYWHEPEKSRRFRTAEITHPLLGESFAEQNRYWSIQLNPKQFSFLRDHKIRGKVIFPAAAYIEMALAASRELFGEPGVIDTVQFTRALVLGDDDWRVELRLSYNDTDGAFAILSRDASVENSEWVTHCTGYLRSRADSGAQQTAHRSAPQNVGESWAKQEVYDALKGVGLHYGPAFQGIEQLLIAPHTVWGEVAAPSATADLGRYLLYPAVLDSCFQVFVGTIPENLKSGRIYLPVRIGRLQAWQAIEGPLGVQAELERSDAKELVCNLRIFDASGQPVATIDDFTCQAIAASETSTSANPVYDVAWEVKFPEIQRLYEPPVFLDSVALADRAICQRLTERFGNIEEQLVLMSEALDELAGAHIRESLQALGIDWTPGRLINPSQAITNLSITPQHRQAFLRLLAVLAELGQLKATPDGVWQIIAGETEKTSQELFREVCLRYPAHFAELTLVQRCGVRLASILIGGTDPLDVLFGQDNNQAAEHLYQDSPSFRVYNTLVAQCVEAAVAAAPLSRKFRVLEIGAGTGGLTTYVLPVLGRESTGYVFTDVSSLFFDKARKKFQDFGFVDYRTLDVEIQPEAQGFAAGEFDLILASDVLHACRNLRDALGHIQTLLAPGGMLIFLEVENAYGWVDLVFGLTEGWWRFQDYDLRPTHPLISRERWAALLHEAGFVSVAPVRFGGGSTKPGQVVMRARKPCPDLDQQNPVVVCRTELQQTEHWLVFAEEGGLVDSVSTALAEAGHRVTTVVEGDQFTQKADRAFSLPAADPAAMARLIETLGGITHSVTGILYLWPLAAPAMPGTEYWALAESETLTCYAPMHMLQAYSNAALALPRRLFLFTRNAQPDAKNKNLAGITQSPVWGLGRVVAHEYPNLVCRLVDLQETEPGLEARAILQEIACEDGETEVIWRSGARYVPRLQHAGRPSLNIDPAAPNLPHFRLIPSDSGVIDRLAFRETPSEPLGPGEVEIRVRAAGLNFRDVLKALGLYPADGGDALLLGDECAGEISAIGPGVQFHAPGDRVLAIAPGSFGSLVRTRQDLIIPMPTDMTFEAAVTVPIAFLTAYYALHELGQIQAGDKVLIQAAAGGVGLAAVQIAKLAGAEIFATAGTQEKRDLLRALGADHVMSSRSLAFADEIKALTQGRGVDIVLNSLAGAAIRKGIDCLAPSGRFLEIGKRDIYQDSRIGLWGFRANVSFHAIDLGRIIARRPDVIHSLFERIVENLANRQYSPLLLRSFPLNRIVEAFRYMAQARHTGKVVITLDGSPVQVERLLPAKIEIDNSAAYLVTGGLGGFGLKVAEWLVDKGARHLILVGRSGVSSTESRDAIATLKHRGVVVKVQQVDISDAAQTKSMLVGLAADGPPLKGIFHAAMVIDDGTLLHLDRERFRRVMAPKVDGCWNLHRWTLDQPLDFFVLFSSISAVIGNPGQANYAAANAFLDAFAQYRQAQGLPALSINWGRIEEVGYVARNSEIIETLEKRGILGISVTRAISIMERLLAQHVANAIVAPVQLPPLGLPPKFVRIQRSNADETRGEQRQKGQGRALILQAPPEKRVEVAEQCVTQLISHTLGIPADRLDQERPLNELGLDSLMAVELINQLESDLEVRIPNSELMKNPTALQITDLVLRELRIKVQQQPEREAEIERLTLAGPPAEESAPAAWSPLVTLQPAGEGPPLFCLHPLGGAISCYQDLAHHLQDRPVYALCGRGSEGRWPPHATMEELIQAYWEALRSVQARGPYYLASWSAGGVLSYELARRIRAQGEEVGLLMLFDTPLPSIYQDINLEDDIKFLFDLGRFANWFSGAEVDVESISYDDARSFDEATRWEIVLEIAKAYSIVPPDSTLHYIRCVIEAGKTHAAIVQNYTIEPFDQTIHLVRPEQPDVLSRIVRQPLGPDLGWGVVLGDRLQLHRSPGDHFSMMNGEQAAKLAELVKACLDKR